jgi:small subunit ribosomal protein S21
VWSPIASRAAFGLLGAVGDGALPPDFPKIRFDRGLAAWSSYPLSPITTAMPIEIKIRKNEPVDRAIRRLKKKLDREGVIKDVRAKRYYEKPCEERRRKEKVAAFTAMLRARYNS